jgi:hypothetical protein
MQLRNVTVDVSTISQSQEDISTFNPRKVNSRFVTQLTNSMSKMGVDQETGLTFVIVADQRNMKKLKNRLARLAITKDDCKNENAALLFSKNKGDGQAIIADMDGLKPSVGQHRAAAAHKILEKQQSGEMETDETLTRFRSCNIIVIDKSSSEARFLAIVRAIRFLGAMDNSVKSLRLSSTFADVVTNLISTVENLCGDHGDWDTLKKNDKAGFLKAKVIWIQEKKRTMAATKFTSNTLGSLAKLCTKPLAIRAAIKKILTITHTQDGEAFSPPTSGGCFVLIGHENLSEAATLGIFKRILAGDMAIFDLKAACRMAIVVELALLVADANIDGFDRSVLKGDGWARQHMTDPMFSGIVRQMSNDLTIKKAGQVPPLIVTNIIEAFRLMKHRADNKQAEARFIQVSECVRRINTTEWSLGWS